MFYKSQFETETKNAQRAKDLFLLDSINMISNFIELKSSEIEKIFPENPEVQTLFKGVNQNYSRLFPRIKSLDQLRLIEYLAEKGEG